MFEESEVALAARADFECVASATGSEDDCAERRSLRAAPNCQA